jgi:hypothetical protein
MIVVAIKATEEGWAVMPPDDAPASVFRMSVDAEAAARALCRRLARAGSEVALEIHARDGRLVRRINFRAYQRNPDEARDRARDNAAARSHMLDMVSRIRAGSLSR